MAHRQSGITSIYSNLKPQVKPSALSKPRVRRSFTTSALQDAPLPTSVIDHITNAEDIFDTCIFSTGSEIKLLQPNSGWEGVLMKQMDLNMPETVGTASTLTVDQFLDKWKSALHPKNGRDIARQFCIFLGGDADDKDSNNGTFDISSDCCDELFSSLNVHLPFFPSLWTAKTAPGSRQWGYHGIEGQTRVIDIWYTVPLSVTVKGEGNFSLASSAIYSRYVVGAPQTSLVMVFLRYNWKRGSLDGQPTRDYETLLEKFKVPQQMDTARSRALNGCQWHLGPQVAYFGMALGLWRQGLNFLHAFAHDQEKKIHFELSDNRQETAINIRSIHLRVKFLHEEIECLQSICLRLDFLYNFWLDEAVKQGEGKSVAGVSTIDDLFLLRDEFSIQMRSRDELVKRLSNVQNLYFNLTTSKIARASKSDSAAMRTIAIVTAIFFPATFVATFMSMSFFNFEESLISLSPSIWIYFVITIPLTMMMLGSLMYWLKAKEIKGNTSSKEVQNGNI